MTDPSDRGVETVVPLDQEQIIVDVFRPVEDAEISVPKLYRITNDNSAVTKDLKMIWSHPKRPASSYGYESNRVPFATVSSPLFTELEPASYETFEQFLAAARFEIRSRYEQDIRFNRLLDHVGSAHTPDDMVTLTNAYAVLRSVAKADEKLKPKSYSPYLAAMFERCGEILADPIDGNASPEAIANFMQPAVQSFMDNPSLAGLYSNYVHRQSGVGQYVSAEMFKQLIPGTAEYVGAVRLRAKLHEAGYEGFEITKQARTQLHKVSDHYLATSTLRALHSEGIIDSVEMPDNKGAVDKAASIIHGVVQELAASGKYPVAQDIVTAYDRLSYRLVSAYDRTVTPYQVTITIANAISAELNKRELFAGDNALPKLDPRGLEYLPAAFQRILFAIDESLLAEATGGRVYDGPVLRKQMVYLEALATQWSDHRNRQPLIIGDIVMRLHVMGYSGDAIIEAINERLEALKGNPDVGRPDDKATKHYKDAKAHPDARPGHVEHRRHTPGYGVIS